MLCVVHREASLEAMTVHLSSYSFVSSVLVTTENVDACSARDFLLTQYTPSTYSNVFLPTVFTVPRPSHTGGLRGNKSSPICTPAYTCARQKGDSEAIPLKCKWWSGEISGGMETAFLSLPPWLHADDQSTTNLAGHKSLNKEISIHSSNRKKCWVNRRSCCKVPFLYKLSFSARYLLLLIIWLDEKQCLRTWKLPKRENLSQWPWSLNLLLLVCVGWRFTQFSALLTVSHVTSTGRSCRRNNQNMLSYKFMITLHGFCVCRETRFEYLQTHIHVCWCCLSSCMCQNKCWISLLRRSVVGHLKELLVFFNIIMLIKLLQLLFSTQYSYCRHII